MPIEARTFYSMNDRSKERSTFSVRVAAFDETTFVAQQTKRAALKAAIAGISLGIEVRDGTQLINIDNGNSVASAAGQRELKGAVRVRDTVTFEEYTWEVPVIDDTLSAAGTDDFDITSGAWASFVAALEDYALSNDGNPIEVLSARVVGRTL